MKQSELKQIIREEIQKLDEGFYRLPSHVVGNELYKAHKLLNYIYDSQKNGNDFDMKNINSLISQLQSIKKQAKQFNSGDDVPLGYEYKKK